MSFINMLSTEPQLNFLELLKSYDSDLQLSWSPSADSKSEGGLSPEDYKATVSLVENGFFSTFPKVVANQDARGSNRKAVDSVCLICFSLVEKLEAKDRNALIPRLQTAILAEEKRVDARQTLSLLVSLFNILPAQSKSRYDTFMIIVDRALKLNALNWIASKSVIDNVDTFVSEWKLNTEQTINMLNALAKAVKSVGRTQDFDKLVFKLLRYLENVEGDITGLDLSDAQEWTRQAIIATLKRPFDEAARMSEMASMRMVKELEKDSKSAALVKILRLYVEEDIDGYTAFAKDASNVAVIEKDGIRDAENVVNFRIFAVCKLGCGEFDYKTVAQAMRLSDVKDVEEAIIQTVLTGRVAAKIDEESGCICIEKTTVREFKDSMWPVLGKKLRKWQEGVGQLLEAVSKTRQD